MKVSQEVRECALFDGLRQRSREYDKSHPFTGVAVRCSIIAGGFPPSHSRLRRSFGGGVFLPGTSFCREAVLHAEGVGAVGAESAGRVRDPRPHDHNGAPHVDGLRVAEEHVPCAAPRNRVSQFTVRPRLPGCRRRRRPPGPAGCSTRRRGRCPRGSGGRRSGGPPPPPRRRTGRSGARR